MQLTEHFSFDELTVTDHTDLQADNRKEAEAYAANLTAVAKNLLEPVRVGMGKPIIINSGFRGKTLNQRVGGSATSQHCLGQAADFNVKGYADRAGQIAVLGWMIEDFKKRGYKWGQLLLERGCIHASLGAKCEVAEYDVPTKTKKPIVELA
jgi:hypothetical protein